MEATERQSTGLQELYKMKYFEQLPGKIGNNRNSSEDLYL